MINPVPLIHTPLNISPSLQRSVYLIVTDVRDQHKIVLNHLVEGKWKSVGCSQEEEEDLQRSTAQVEGLLYVVAFKIWSFFKGWQEDFNNWKKSIRDSVCSLPHGVDGKHVEEGALVRWGQILTYGLNSELRKSLTATGGKEIQEQ